MSRRAALEQVLALSRLCADGAKRTVVANPAGSTRLPFLQNQLRAVVLPAQESSEDESLPREVLRTRVDDFGGVSVISEGESDAPPRSYRNVDGQRLEDGRYAAFMEEISSFVPKARQFTDAVRTFAYGTDASFYRLNPKLVVKVHTEDEIARILPIAHKHQVPVTFRAAGTSLSGQAITDSVLLKLSHTGKNWRAHHVHVCPPCCDLRFWHICTVLSCPLSKQAYPLAPDKAAVLLSACLCLIKRPADLAGYPANVKLIPWLWLP